MQPSYFCFVTRDMINKGNIFVPITDPEAMKPGGQLFATAFCQELAKQPGVKVRENEEGHAVFYIPHILWAHLYTAMGYNTDTWSELLANMQKKGYIHFDQETASSVRVRFYLETLAPH